jgi:CheY-like chemotaxis protein
VLQYELVETQAFEETHEFRQLRRLLKRIAPLHLIDPQAPEFTPQNCESVHDVIRFIHEKAVNELMDLPRFLKRFKGVKIFTLSSDVPLGLKILDLGGGIDPLAQGSLEALHEIQGTTYDIIITDLKMKGIDGMRFLQEAKKTHPATEVIVITGFATLDTAKESFQKGVFDFIAKPFKLSEIQEVVTKAAAKIRGSGA